MFYTPGWGALATSAIAVIAIVASAYWNCRTLNATDQRARTERLERALDKKRAAIAEVVAAGGTHVDAASLLVLRLQGITTTERSDLVDRMLRVLEENYGPTKRDLVTKVYSAQFVVDEQPVTDALINLLDHLEVFTAVDGDEIVTGLAAEEIDVRQNELMNALKKLRHVAIEQYGPAASPPLLPSTRSE